ncbi:MAG: protein TonB [Flavobacterium sp.]|jgi:protein TonB
MKLDLFNNKWLEIVFEGRNKSYGAYELRKDSKKTTFLAMFIGAVIFSLAVATPKIMDLLGSGNNDELALDKKIVTIKLPPKEEVKKIENQPPPPPPPPKVDQVKFTKPVVAKKEEITEDPPKVKELEKKVIGDKDIKGDPDAPLTLGPIGDGPKEAAVTEDNSLYNMAGIEVKPDFPGGLGKFYKFVGDKFEPPTDDEFKGGKVFVTFVVEKDGSLTDIKVVRDVGFGTGKEAIRVLKSSPRWKPGVQNGKPVRVQYSLPITINAGY